MSKFIVSTQAAEDIENFRQYLIQQNSEQVSNEFLEAIYEKFSLLANYPRMGKSRNDLLQGLLSFPRSIFYKKVPKGIKVLRVLGGYQDHQNILKSV